MCIARGLGGAITVRTRRRLDRGPLALRFEPTGVSTNIAGERTCGLSGRTHGYKSDVYKLVWWMAHGSRQGCRATINYTKSTVLPRVSDLTQKATLATGKILIEVGYKLTDCCTSK